MKREIRFRGKRLDNGEWVYGDLSYGVTYTSESTQRDYRIGAGISFYSVSPETIGQFIGHHYMDGRAIYEGDIVKLAWYEHCTLKNGHAKAVVAWKNKNASFVLEKQNGQSLLINENTRGIVYLGNIHDNPELLTHPKNED